MNLKSKILEQTNDPSIFDRLIEEKTPTSRQLVLKYKVVCEGIASSPKREKIFPINYPKLMRSRTKE